MKTVNNVNPNGLSASEFRQYKVVCAALWCMYHVDEVDYIYGYRGKDYVAEWKKPPYIPHAFDCSGFVTYCYNISGAPDPNGNNYSGQTSTGSLWGNGKLVGTSSYKVASLEPADLVFYANSTPGGGTSEHVSVYISDGMVISHGGASGPHAVSIETDAKYSAPVYGIRRYPFGT